MTRGRRLAACGALAIVAAVAPWLTWIGRERASEECGWTCYVPLPAGAQLHRIDGVTGFAVAPVAAVAALALAILLVAWARWSSPVLGAAVVAAGVATVAGAAAAWSTHVHDPGIVEVAGRASDDRFLSPAVGVGLALAALAGLVAMVAGAGATWRARHPRER